MIPMDKQEISQRVEALRRAMKKEGVDAVIIPDTDPHLSEYPADHWKVRDWITGFTGSAGTAVVTAEKAGLWTDFRYFLEAGEVLEGTPFALMKKGEPGVPEWDDWLAEALPAGGSAAVKADLISLKGYTDLQAKLGAAGIEVRTDWDFLGDLWTDRPGLPGGPVEPFPAELAGRSREEKLAQLREGLRRSGATSCLLGPLDDIAWLLNVRGRDVPYNPVVISLLLILRERAVWFVDPERVPAELRRELEGDGVTLHPYGDWAGFLGKLTPETVGEALYLAPERTGLCFCLAVPEDIPVQTGPDMVEAFKALKNGTEQEALGRAMEKDGAAMVRFLMGLEEMLAGEAAGAAAGEAGGVRGRETIGTAWTEAEAAEFLRRCRAAQPGFRGESFAPIVGYRGHGAVVHYDFRKGEPARIEPEGLLLVDSGGHYGEGTTDITRTVACGEPTEEQIRDYTLVLKGHIALARVLFPEGTAGWQLDSLARRPLWEAGASYGHGTGHGVGFCLNVHEGPQSISTKPGSAPLQPGMVISNEPGLYRAGRWGIRIENLILTHWVDETTEFGRFLRFETLTLCPLDRRLIDAGLLTAEERAWVDDYHREVAERLSPRLEPAEREWLAQRCRPLGQE